MSKSGLCILKQVGSIVEDQVTPFLLEMLS